MGNATEASRFAAPLSGGPGSDGMLLHDALPRYHFREVHSIVVRAAPAQTWRAICRLTPGELRWC